MKSGCCVVPLLLLSAAGAAGAGQPVEITEWQVPWENTRPRDPYVDGRHQVWFVGQTGDYVAVLDPESGAFERFPLADGTGPHNLIVDQSGKIWYAGNRAAHIGRLDPEDGAVTRYPMPEPGARDPHTLVFNSGGEIWFSVQHGNYAGRFDPVTAKIRLVPMATPKARPYGVVVASDDRPWLAEFSTNRLATVDPVTFEVEEIVLPREAARPRRLQASSDGRIWYGDYAGGMLGVYDPRSRAFTEWQTPGGHRSRPYAMAIDDRDRLWFVETGPRPNRLVGFDPRDEEFFAVTEIPSGGGTVRHMVFYQPAREIWFGTDTNTIGRARIP